jgi:hypothetical protein
LLWAAGCSVDGTRRQLTYDPEIIVGRFGGDIGELLVNSVQAGTVFVDGVPNWFTNSVRDPANNSKIQSMQRTINDAIRDGESLHILFGLWGCRDKECNKTYVGTHAGVCSCGKRARCMRTSEGGDNDVFIAIIAICDTPNCGGYALFEDRCSRCGTHVRTIHVPNNWTARKKLHYAYVHKFEDGKFVGSLSGGTEIISDVHSACEQAALEIVPLCLKSSKTSSGLKSITPKAKYPDDLGQTSFGLALLKHLKNNKQFDGELLIGTTQYVSVGPYNSTRLLTDIAA